MTPYSFAFTIVRTIAVLMLLIGIFHLSDFYSQVMNRPDIDRAGVWSWVWHNFILTVCPGALLYVFAHWLAKIAVWKIKD